MTWGFRALGRKHVAPTPSEYIWPQYISVYIILSNTTPTTQHLAHAINRNHFSRGTHTFSTLHFKKYAKIFQRLDFSKGTPRIFRTSNNNPHHANDLSEVHRNQQMSQKYMIEECARCLFCVWHRMCRFDCFRTFHLLHGLISPAVREKPQLWRTDIYRTRYRQGRSRKAVKIFLWTLTIIDSKQDNKSNMTVTITPESSESQKPEGERGASYALTIPRSNSDLERRPLPW